MIYQKNEYVKRLRKAIKRSKTGYTVMKTLITEKLPASTESESEKVVIFGRNWVEGGRRTPVVSPDLTCSTDTHLPPDCDIIVV